MKESFGTRTWGQYITALKKKKHIFESQIYFIRKIKMKGAEP